MHTHSACLSTAARAYSSEKHAPLQSAQRKQLTSGSNFFTHPPPSPSASPAPRRGSESELSFTAKSQLSGFWPRLLGQSSPRSQDVVFRHLNVTKQHKQMNGMSRGERCGTCQGNTGKEYDLRRAGGSERPKKNIGTWNWTGLLDSSRTPPKLLINQRKPNDTIDQQPQTNPKSTVTTS